MDSKDFRLLVALHENARQSYRSLGRYVSLSAPAVRERLERLEKRRILHGYWAYADPAVLHRRDVMVFFNGDWDRNDVVKLLQVPDVAFAAWKLDGGVTIQLWPKTEKASVGELTNILGKEPSGRALSAPHKISKLSVADWRILDALLDEPLAPLGALVERTALTSKTVRKHLRAMLLEEAVFIMPLLGSLADSGQLVYHLAVEGNAGMSELRSVLGDSYMIGGADRPPMKYLLCSATDLADVTSRTRSAGKLPGVKSVRVTLNRELFPGNEFVHSLVREHIPAT